MGNQVEHLIKALERFQSKAKRLSPPDDLAYAALMLVEASNRHEESVSIYSVAGVLWWGMSCLRCINRSIADAFGAAFAQSPRDLRESIGYRNQVSSISALAIAPTIAILDGSSDLDAAHDRLSTVVGAIVMWISERYDLMVVLQLALNR